MAELTYSSSLYTNINKWTELDDGTREYHGILVSSKLNQKNGQDYKLLDAIDIDWNGAFVSSANMYLNTTEDLIWLLNEINKNSNIDIINKDLESIWKQINEITSSYITTTTLSEILNKSWQQKLIAGNHIKIEDNVITTYNLPSYQYLENNYTALSDYNWLKSELIGNYFNKYQTQEEILKAVTKAIDEVINGADSAFDTLKEIADWILSQNRYIEVDPRYVIDNWEENTFFTFDKVNNKYVLVNSKDEVITDGSIQYYKLENYFTDIKKLIEDVANLESDVDNINDNIYKINNNIDWLQGEIANANKASNIALEKSEFAYTAANIAYEKATYSLELTVDSIEKSNIAYKVAIKASEDVGYATIKGLGYVEISYEEIETKLDENYDIYYFSSKQNSYIIANPPFYKETKYFIFDEGIDGTGLTKRVEDVELNIDNVNEDIINLNSKVNKTLYNLYVNNSKSSYVKINLDPIDYQGNSSRTIHITTDEAIIDSETGEIMEDGLVNVGALKNMYTYLTSWQIIEVETLK